MADGMREVTRDELNAFVEHYPPKKRLRRNVQQIGYPPTIDYDDVVTPGLETQHVAQIRIAPDGEMESDGTTFWIDDFSPEYLEILERWGLTGGG